MSREDEPAERHHFKIGEVAEMLDVRPHILRYWEQEFPALRPKKTRGAHRHYSRANVALARVIRELVVEQGYSIAGARARLSEHVRGDASAHGHASVQMRVAEARSLAERRELEALRDDLASLLSLVDRSRDACIDEDFVEDAENSARDELVRIAARGRLARS